MMHLVRDSRVLGAFVKMEGHERHGLVHVSQMVNQRVERVEDVLQADMMVWVKVLEVTRGVRRAHKLL